MRDYVENTPKAALSMVDELHFLELTKSIHAGSINQELLVHFLLLPSLEARIWVNDQLAKIFYEIKNYEQAEIHAERAWIFSDCDPVYMDRYIHVLEQLGEIDKIAFIYKRTGMSEVKRENYESAINLFNDSYYTKARFLKKDIYEYDYEILDKVREIGEKFVGATQTNQPNKKIKLAYLTYGLADAGSVFANIIPLFAKYHDKERFEITFFVPEREEQIVSQPYSEKLIQQIRDAGCNVLCAPNLNNRFHRWLDTAQSICKFSPDIFITFAALARLEYYLIASALPKNIRKIALIYGPPAQFAPPEFYMAIGHSRHPLMDIALNIQIKQPTLLENTDRKSDYTFDKRQLDIPNDSIVLISSGRYTKFQNPMFWEIIENVLTQHEHAYFICIGPAADDVSLLRNLAPSISKRIKCLGWRTDVDQVLSCADVYINTFPNGGGYTVREAIQNNLPVISFSHNYLCKFDQNRWNPIDDIIDLHDLIIPYDEKDLFIFQLTRLIMDKEFREEMASQCLNSMKKKLGCPKSSMLLYEETLKLAIL